MSVRSSASALAFARTTTQDSAGGGLDGHVWRRAKFDAIDSVSPRAQGWTLVHSYETLLGTFECLWNVQDAATVVWRQRVFRYFKRDKKE